MASQAVRIRRGDVSPAPSSESMRPGMLVGMDAGRRPLVTYAGGPGTPTPARVASSVVCPPAAELEQGVPAVLMFDAGDVRASPIIVALVRDTFTDAGNAAVLEGTGLRRLEVNGTAVVLEGQDEIVLRCGLGSLIIRADGRIVIKGTRIISRASETNRIRGASVEIN